MAIEVTDGGTLITGNDINLYRLMAIASGLAIEINTGMRTSQVSAMKVAKRVCGSGKGTKARVLADLILFTRERFPHFTPTQTMVRALETLPTRQLGPKRRAALGL